MRLRRALSTAVAAAVARPPSPVDRALLRRIATVLFHHRCSPTATLHRRLALIPLPPPHHHPELFLQLTSLYPSPPSITRFLSYLTLSHSFAHTPATSARYISILASSQNLALLHSTLVSLPTHMLSPFAIRFAARGFAEGRDVTKCAKIIKLAPHGEVSALEIVVREVCCHSKLPEVALKVIERVRSDYAVVPSRGTWDYIIVAFCRAGEMEEACQVWNAVRREGTEVGMQAYMEIAVSFFKADRFEEGLLMFRSMRRIWFQDMGLCSYRAVVRRLCVGGMLECALMVCGDMVKRGMDGDPITAVHLISVLFEMEKVEQAYKVFNSMLVADISLYNSLIRGLVRLRRMREATQVFRNMIENGCEPNMHTYIMLLKGHMGVHGKKGRNCLVNFDTIFVGGLVKAGKSLEANKFAERIIWKGINLPKFDYNMFLHCFSNEEGAVMFEEVGRKLQEVGIVDLGFVFLIYGKRMATRERRRNAMNESKELLRC